MSCSRSYLRIFFGLTLLVLLGVAIFCRIMNPYAIYTGPELDGINKLKPEFRRHVRMAKAWAVYEQQPQSISIGSSRIEYGIDPNHPAWAGEAVYNLGVSSANMYEALRYFQHAQAIQPLDKVVLGLDLYMFNALVKPQNDFSEPRLCANPDGSINENHSALEKLSTLFSIDALEASMGTLKTQDPNEVSRTLYLSNGQVDGAHRQMTILKDNGGCHNAFEQVVRYYMKNGLGGSRDFSFSDNTGYSPFDDFETLLETAHRNNVNLKIIISPFHAYYTEVINHLGLWPLFEEWKRRLVNINETVGEKFGRPPFEIWDFGGYNSITTETVPSENHPKEVMRWYLEPSHYSSNTGDLILDRIFEYDAAGRNLPADFGVVLTPESIEEALAFIRNAAANYRASHAEIGKILQGETP